MGMENDSFCLKQGQDLGNRATHPHQESPGVPPPPPPSGLALARYVSISVLT